MEHGGADVDTQSDAFFIAFARARDAVALAMAEKHGLEPSVANSLCDLGFAELGAGRPDRSRVRFGEALEAAVRLGWKENVAYSLVGFGAIAVEAGQLDSPGASSARRSSSLRTFT